MSQNFSDLGMVWNFYNEFVKVKFKFKKCDKVRISLIYIKYPQNVTDFRV